MSEHCYIPHYQACCCSCRNRVVDHSHPLTDGGRTTEQRGWICAHPELGHTSGWPEHGLCESWISRVPAMRYTGPSTGPSTGGTP